ncbi:MAG: NADH-quinone oxidoreductase subunit C [Proteobacteria bacterium]|nr:NADH-quinone oxidoreductase subunit C [Pseudomonadota bacterium]
MTFASLGLQIERLEGVAPAWRARVGAAAWRECAEQLAAKGARLAALWACDERDRAGGARVLALYASAEGLLCLDLAVSDPPWVFPDLSDLFPCAGRMQRAAHDLNGVRAVAHSGAAPDARPWLRHAGWPANRHPLARDFDAGAQFAPTGERYAFVPVEGEGVHEIPVGPVHAGIIEPGHFRFSVVGEHVLRLEERLGYTHKGIEKRFEALGLLGGAKLAGRVSGDSTVAYAWAYAMALEGMAGIAPPPRAAWLRALLLERERIANHLGDLGYLGNDGGLAFGLAQFSRLKEDVLRLNERLFGSRYLMDRVIPGGVACDVDAAGADLLHAQGTVLAEELRTMRRIYEDHSGLQDRFIACGRLAPELAARLGVVGLPARASGIAIDARIEPGLAPYDRLEPRIAMLKNGDVAARVDVRFEEAFESLRLVGHILAALREEPAGGTAVELRLPPAGAFGLGWVEGWRGEVFVALEAGPDGSVRRCHPHDPSWQNWPAIEHAIIGNIVPDFPLINKSFNLSYSGQDL